MYHTCLIGAGSHTYLLHATCMDSGIDKSFGTSLRLREERLACWNPLRGHALVLHVDGSSLENPVKAGYVAVIQDSLISGWKGFQEQLSARAC